MTDIRQAMPAVGQMSAAKAGRRGARNGARPLAVPRLTGALARATLVVATVATPALLVPGTTGDTALLAAFVAVVAGTFIAIEYNAAAPSLVSFRDAPPYNRLRFGALFVTVLALSLIVRGGTDPTALNRLVAGAGGTLAHIVDIPYSPVRLVVLMLPADVSPAIAERVRLAAGLSYVLSIVMLGTFVLLLRVQGWPGRQGRFNVWVNLPLFDPTTGRDVVVRLRQDAQVNLVLGFLLPFLVPAAVKLAAMVAEPIDLGNAHTLIWTMTAWAFLPASLWMRGLALNRIASMIRQQQRRLDDGEPGPLAQI